MKKLSQWVSTILNLSTKSKLAAFLVIFGVIGTTVFQNCAKGKFNLSPEQVQQLAQAYCQGGVTTTCANETGTGLQCSVANTEAAAGVCVFQSCNPGYRLVGNLCTPTACTPNSVASCTYTVEGRIKAMLAAKVVQTLSLMPEEENVALGQGTMTCNSEGTGYGVCTPITCELRPQELTKLGGVVRNISQESPSSSSSSPFPFPSGSPPFPSSSSPSPSYSSPSPSPTYSSPSPSPTPSPSPSIAEFCKYSCEQGTQICAMSQSMSPAYKWEKVCTGETGFFSYCNITDCAAGYAKITYPDEGFSCQKTTCTPNDVRACDNGVGHGTATCDSLGLEYGACQITSCDEGYKLEGGACVLDEPAIICVANQYTEPYVPCDVPNGAGIERCNGSGTAKYCQVQTCNQGYNNYFGYGTSNCEPNICTPGETSACEIPNGVGVQTCSNTGAYYDQECQAGTCSPGFINFEGSCLACEPNSIITDNSCTSPLINGVSTQRVCSADGSSSTCRTTGCAEGFTAAYGAEGIEACVPLATKVAPKKK